MVPCSDTRPGAAGAFLMALLVDVLATLINLVAVAQTCGFSFRFSDSQLLQGQTAASAHNFMGNFVERLYRRQRKTEDPRAGWACSVIMASP